MKERGFIAINRKIFQNPLLADPAYFRAWVWLLCEAAWKPTRRRVVAGRAVTILNLGRGQLSHSRRFIAEALGMTEQRVRTFLNHLKIDGMINLQTNQGQTIITICKYDDYQSHKEEDNQQNNQEINQQSTGNQPKLNKDNNLNKEDIGAAAPAENVVPIRPGFTGVTTEWSPATVERWRRMFPAIEDLQSSLRILDAYYTDHPRPDGKYFFPAQKWLEKENREAPQRAKQAARDRGDAW